MYTVFHRKGGSTFVVMTLEQLVRFLLFLHCCKQEGNFLHIHAKHVHLRAYLNSVLTLPCENETSHFILL